LFYDIIHNNIDVNISSLDIMNLNVIYSRGDSF